MKLTDSLLKFFPKVRYTTKEHEVQFKLELPMKLRNHVSGASTRSSGKNCIQEMYVMMACLKKGDFDQTDCGREIQAFRSCSEKLSREFARKRKEAKSFSTTGNNLTTHQLNEFLKKYPQKYDIYD